MIKLTASPAVIVISLGSYRSSPMLIPTTGLVVAGADGWQSTVAVVVAGFGDDLIKMTVTATITIPSKRLTKIILLGFLAIIPSAKITIVRLKMTTKARTGLADYL